MSSVERGSWTRRRSSPLFGWDIFGTIFLLIIFSLLTSHMNLMLTDHSQPILSHIPNARLPPLFSTNLFLMLVSLTLFCDPVSF